MQSLFFLNLSFLLSAFCVLVIECQDCINQLCTLGDESIAFKTPTYPDPYVNADPVKLLSVRVNPNSNYAFGVQYYRFVTDYQNDYLFFCDVDDFRNCSSSPKYSVTGTAIDNYFPVDYYDKSDVLYLFFSPTKSSTAWPGILGKVTRLDKTTQLYNNCSKEAIVDLDSISGGFYTLVSDHFSRQYFDHTFDLGAQFNTSCITKLQTNKSTNIRMIVYSFQSNPQQLLNMTGIRANESSVTTTLLSGIKEIGDFKTYYYRNELTLSYSFTFVEDTDDDPYADYYYYIVISAYNDTNTPAFDQCQNVGAFDMSKTSIIDFSAQDVNSTFGYHKNSNCKWVFENPPFNHQLMISFYHFVTEKCCDVITVGGANLAFPSHSGSDIPWLVYGVSNRMEVVFQSDSLEEYTYMVGQARAINCTCPQSSITLTVNQTASISYGWVAKFPFCSPMACNSTITFDRDSILQFDVQYSASMNSNLVVTDSTKDRFITGSLSDTTSHDWLQVSFSNSLVTDLYKMWDSTGYSVSVKALPLKIQQIDIDLCSQEFIVLMGETLTYKYDTAIYRLDGSNCTGSQITSTFLSMSDGYLLDVYDGELANGALAMTSFNGPANFTFTSNFATIRLIKTNDLYRPGFRVIVAANPQISVYSPTNDCSKQNLFSVPLIGNGNDIKILYRGTTPFPGDYLGLYGMDLVFPSAALPIEIYQGTTLDNNNKIYGGDSLCDPITTKSALPSFIFGEFVVIKLVSKVVDPSASVFFRCQQQVDANLTLAMNSPVPGLLIAPQYTDIDYSPDPQTYSFIIQYLDVKDFQGIALTFLNPIPGDSNLTISYTENGNLTTQRLINESTVCYVEIPTWAVSLSYQWFCRTSPFELVNNCQRPLLIKFEPIFSPTTQQSKVANDWRQILLLALVVSYFSCD